MTTPRRTGVRPVVVPLEPRDVPAASLIRSLDGSGNNLTNPAWGQAGIDFLRVAPAAYADGVSTPAGSDRPSARAVSNAVSDQPADTVSDRQLSAMVYAWGQFIDHDLDLTKSGSTEAFNIPVPAGDPQFDPTGTGTQVVSMSRSGYDPATGTAGKPRQQVNLISAFVDGSMVYGSDATTAASLRTFQGGKMKTSDGNLLPTDASGFFQTGDIRANENPELTSLQTLFVREHNRLAARFAAANPALTDEQLFQKARAWVIGELQAITYNEWLPALLGGDGVGAYRGYNPRVNPGISNEFATAGFRFGHSAVGPDVEFIGNDGTEVADGLSFADAFFNPAAVKANGIDPLLKYLASDPSQEIDTKVVDDLRNMLVPFPGATVRLDLAALNIQRGRDHGLSDYNTTRAAFGLPKVTSFAQITSNPTLQAKLRQVYGSVDKLDLWVGVLAEDHVRGGSVGPTARAIIADQFGRVRAGDRLWYESTFAGADLRELRNTRLTDLIRRNTTLTTVQANPFYFRPEVSGAVTGPRGPVPGATVQLIDADGEVAAEGRTDGRGRYRLGVADGVRTGNYTVRVVQANGTTTDGPAVSLASGDSRATADVRLGAPSATPPRPPARPQPPAPTRADIPDGFEVVFHGTDVAPRRRR